VSNEFKIDNDKINEISEKFQVDKNSVETLHKVYEMFSIYIKGQFLAHFMRGIECYIREYLNDKRFIVICEPYKEFCPEQKPASSLYYAPKKEVRSDDKNRSSFIINYNKDLCDKELRDYIAHEIGHLLLRKLKDERTKDLFKNFDTFNANLIEEKCSSIFGIYIISEKNDFYNNIPSLLRYKKWQELFKHFQEITHGSII